MSETVPRFAPDRATYIRDHAVMIVLGGIGAAAVLFFLDVPDIWVGPVAALAAITLRGAYLMSEEMEKVWMLSGNELVGPQGRRVFLHQIEKVRTLGSAAQIVTSGGDKHLIKYLADPKAAKVQIEAAMAGRRG